LTPGGRPRTFDPAAREEIDQLPDLLGVLGHAVEDDQRVGPGVPVSPVGRDRAIKPEEARVPAVAAVAEFQRQAALAAARGADPEVPAEGGGRIEPGAEFLEFRIAPDDRQAPRAEDEAVLRSGRHARREHEVGGEGVAPAGHAGADERDILAGPRERLAEGLGLRLDLGGRGAFVVGLRRGERLARQEGVAGSVPDPRLDLLLVPGRQRHALRGLVHLRGDGVEHVEQGRDEEASPRAEGVAEHVSGEGRDVGVQESGGERGGVGSAGVPRRRGHVPGEMVLGGVLDRLGRECEHVREVTHGRVQRAGLFRRAGARHERVHERSPILGRGDGGGRSARGRAEHPDDLGIADETVFLGPHDRDDGRDGRLGQAFQHAAPRVIVREVVASHFEDELDGRGREAVEVMVGRERRGAAPLPAKPREHTTDDLVKEVARRAAHRRAGHRGQERAARRARQRNAHARAHNKGREATGCGGGRLHAREYKVRATLDDVDARATTLGHRASPLAARAAPRHKS
jgi:hypothetical protein